MSENTSAALVLASAVEETAITFQPSQEQLDQLRANLDAHIEAAETLVANLQTLAGPTPSPLPQQMLTMMQLGTGHYRHCRDTLRALSRELNRLRKTQPK